MEPQIIAETNQYFVINKPAGLATEPPSSNQTLKDWLISQRHIDEGDWSKEDRYGVVHRLDTDTSGLIIWAKNQSAQEDLRKLWQGRAVQKTYLALVSGEAPEQGTIEVALMRDNKKDRQTIALLPSPNARPAITKYQRLAVGNIATKNISLIEAQPITGRTHQIRVHLKSIGHPIVGDNLYGDKAGRELAKKINLKRQFLHAWKITFQNKNYQAPLPADLQNVLKNVNIQFNG